MKNFCITLSVIAIISLTAIAVYFQTPQKNTTYLRIHIRANSNLEIDQSVKYRVKDSVVEYLTPFVAECKTVEQAKDTISKLLPNISEVANITLKANQFSYTANAKLTAEEFPLRTYENLTLESGIYDALIVELGEAKGDNWWCVVYPPLCFTGEGVNYVYKSKIIDVINDFFKKQ